MTRLSSDLLLPGGVRQRRTRHFRRHGAALKRFRMEVQRQFLRETERMCREFASGPLDGHAALVTTALGDYVTWLGWCVWCSAHLAPPLRLVQPRDVRRAAAALLVYCGPRIVDDAMDDHRSYKGFHDTLLAEVIRATPARPEAAVRSTVALVGSWLLLYGLQRLRRHGQPDAAQKTLRLCVQIAPGAVLESLHSTPFSWEEYQEVVQRKAVCYDQILYRNLVDPTPEPLKRDVLAIAARLSALAQHLNDLHDRRDDLASGQRNAIDWFPSDEAFWEFCRAEGRDIVTALDAVPPEVGDAFSAALIDTVDAVARMAARPAPGSNSA